MSDYALFSARNTKLCGVFPRFSASKNVNIATKMSIFATFSPKSRFSREKVQIPRFLEQKCRDPRDSAKKGELSEKMEIPRLFRAQILKTKMSISVRKGRIPRFRTQKCPFPREKKCKFSDLLSKNAEFREISRKCGNSARK